MKFLAAALFGLSLAVGAPLRSDVALRFAPEDGGEMRMEYVRVFSLELGESTSEVSFDGEDQGDAESPEIGYEMTETESITYVDNYRVEDGEIVGIERHFEVVGNLFEELTTDPFGAEHEDETPGASELEGATVVFDWDAESEEFEASFAESSEDLDEGLLEELDARADLADFLPDGNVSVGDTWDIPVSAFIRMTNLSGDLSVVQEGREPTDEDDEYGKQFDENLEGSFSAEFSELLDEDGATVAVLVLSAELSTSIETAVEVDADGTTGSEEEVSVFEFELQGVLHWDVKAARATHLHLAGDITLETETDKTYEFEGHELAVHETQSYAGTLDFAATIE